jgi:hypothetical protein
VGETVEETVEKRLDEVAVGDDTDSARGERGETPDDDTPNDDGEASDDDSDAPADDR